MPIFITVKALRHPKEYIKDNIVEILLLIRTLDNEIAIRTFFFVVILAVNTKTTKMHALEG